MSPEEIVGSRFNAVAEANALADNIEMQTAVLKTSNMS